jgi:hypothetical protein
MVIRPLATSIPYMTWLIWRTVFLDNRGAIACKSATISVMGFSEEFLVVRDHNFTRKALFHSTIFGEGIAFGEDFFRLLTGFKEVDGI